MLEAIPYLTTIIDATPAMLIALDETFHIVDCNADSRQGALGHLLRDYWTQLCGSSHVP